MATATAAAAATSARRPLIYYGYWIVCAAVMAPFVSIGLLHIAPDGLHSSFECSDVARHQDALQRRQFRVLNIDERGFLG